MKKINDLLKEINIEPNNIGLYYEALTHKSFSNEKKLNIDYQRFEFLGDAILDFLVSEYLLKYYKNLSEGDMSIIRSNSVKGTRLAKFARELELDKYIRFGNNVKDFKENAKIYADVFESLVAAIYLDHGVEKAKEFIKGNVFKYIDESKDKEVKNPKTILQEFLQLESRGTIEYIATVEGKEFTVEVFHDGTKFGSGKGTSKKEAEVQAAKNALELLGKVK